MVVQRNRDQGTSEMNSGEERGLVFYGLCVNRLKYVRKMSHKNMDRGCSLTGEGTVEHGIDGVSGDEQFRDQRIKENKERTQKLGILDLAVKLKPKAAPPKRSQSQRFSSVQTKIHNGGSPRRSSRLKNLAPVSYVEIRKPKEKNDTSEGVDIYIKEGSQPEVYTKEHEKKLGDRKTSWPLGMDLVKGESCHQCRQKTLGQHTHCCKCDSVQGEFCGDCLYTRYGENVIEANQNPDWVCPVCRGICNCNLCRKAKGWEPTGNLYWKVSKLRYKSVAHYLIQSRCSQIKSETSGTEVAEEGSEPSSHHESPETFKGLDNSTIHTSTQGLEAC